ncbi:MAG: LLM class flavin-dependent oxidoreductase [Ornithinimicrobium sp.]
MLPREVSPADIARVAVACEEAGFDELWVVEDCFYTGGLICAALALSATSQITVGIGILPAVVRNPAFTAMEAATLAGAFEQRVHLGIGHGVAAWMRQIGAQPASWLRSLEETTEAVRDLLHGETVSVSGAYVRLDQVRLEFVPEHPPLLSLGVRGPKSVTLAGRVADGVILAEPTPVEYISAARGQLLSTRASAAPAPRVTAYSWAGLGQTSEQKLRENVTNVLREGASAAHLAALDDASRAALARVGNGETDLSDDLLHTLALTGGAANIRAGVRARHVAGADSVVLVPTQAPTEPLLTEIAALGQVLTS